MNLFILTACANSSIEKIFTFHLILVFIKFENRKNELSRYF